MGQSVSEPFVVSWVGPDRLKTSHRGQLRAYDAQAADFSLELVIENGDDSGEPTVVRFVAKPQREGCLLHVEIEAPEDLRARDHIRVDWTLRLRRLRDHLEALSPVDHDDWYERVSSGPKFHSQFGGFWTDRNDAEALLEGKRELGMIDDEMSERLANWIQNGYARFEGGVSKDAIAAFHDELDGLWDRGHPELMVELSTPDGFKYQPIHQDVRNVPHKLLDLHGYAKSARDLFMVPAIEKFLSALFERPPMLFNSLMFEYGSEQPLHQDTAFVPLTSPMEFVGVWIALEEIVEGSGELIYVEGSHRLPEFLWDGRARACAHGAKTDDYYVWVALRCQDLGLTQRSFCAQAGDVFIWHADLAHGGTARVDPALTRRSLVGHMCPVNNTPEYWYRMPHTERIPTERHTYYCHQRRGL